MYRLFISVRYLRSRVVMALALVTVVVSVMAFVVIMSVLQGFNEELREGIRRMHAHIDVRRRFFQPIPDYEKLTAGISSIPGVKGVVPYVGGPAVVQTTRYKAYRWVKGVRLDEEMKYSRLDEFLGATRSFAHPDPEIASRYPGIILGKRFMEEVDLVAGDYVWLTAQGDENERARKMTFVSVGRADTGASWLDQFFMLIDFGEAQKLFRCETGATGLSIWLEDSGELRTREVADAVDLLLNPAWDAGAVRREVAGRFGKNVADAVGEELARRSYGDSASSIASRVGKTCSLGEDQVSALVEALLPWIDRTYQVTPWFEQREDIFKAINMQSVVMRVILVFFFLMMGVSIFVILWMVAAEKTRDIGLLRAVGATTAGIVAIFLGTGSLIGLAGTALGLLAGVPIAWNVDYLARALGLGTISSDLFGMTRLPCRFDPWDFAVVTAATLAISVVASALPAWRASRVDPVESLRHE